MKQILLINDIAGYGKVGMAAMLPVLSYMGIPAFCMPTAFWLRPKPEPVTS